LPWHTCHVAHVTCQRGVTKVNVEFYFSEVRSSGAVYIGSTLINDWSINDRHNICVSATMCVWTGR
jgi:hypothetical protein